MQSPTQSNSEQNPGATATTEQPPGTDTEPQPAQSEPDAQGDENISADTETPATAQENGFEAAASPAAAETECADQPPPEPADNRGGMETDAPSEAAPDTHTDPVCAGRKTKKQEKVARDGRKYVPSKKAMIDPLKMDMSKPVVMPLTSSQLSLQCIECHIIFSDHKSKERHLKLSHPAEYEQCILRNALFACYVCDRHFTNSTELMVHQKAHIEKKPFKCPICGQAFNKSSELTLHKKVHFGQDGYACTDCGKPCKTMTLLKYHRRTHTGERPYVCKECGKRFTMSKALQKHMVAHLPEGAEVDGNETTTTKAQLKKDGGTKYPCSICKATFKSTKTRLHHMKTKHNMLPASSSHVLSAVQQSTPIITPISICQPALLQVEPNGPLQKVDANIDTEQIRKLIESLGNVQKVNQVVILGQVPPHAPPLEVQQIPQLAPNFNVIPSQLNFMGLKHTESHTIELDSLNNPCDPMEQTIILEPITPDGQLENPSFSELGSQLAAGENIELTLVQTEQTETSEGEVINHIIQQHHMTTVQSDSMDQIVCQNEVVDLEQNLEQTVILELTPALIPTMELEQYQTVPQHEIQSSSLVTELEKTPDQAPDQTPDQIVIDEQDNNQSVASLMHTVELEMTSLQRVQPDLPSSPLISSDTHIQTQSDTEINAKEDIDLQIETVSLNQVHTVNDKADSQETQENVENEPESEKVLIDSIECHKEVEILLEEEALPAREEGSSAAEAKQVPQISELPINVMSAQELVKVRKRKPARAFIFQGYRQELVGSLYNDEFQIEAKPSKRQRTKKSHLVVKFGPQSKEKKNKKQKQTQEELMRNKTPSTNLSAKKVQSQKGKKGKKDKKVGNLISTAKMKSPSSTQDSEMQEVKDVARKKKVKNQKVVVRDGVRQLHEHKSGASPVFKKKKQAKIVQKVQRKNTKDGKQKKNMAKEKKVNARTSITAPDIPSPHIMQDSLLLLKGHKQPQLKVYKLDPSKASSQTQEVSPHESQTMSQQSTDNELQNQTSKSTNNLNAEGKKKGARAKKNQKALSLLSSLNVTHQPSETLPPVPKTTRKRKSSSKVETEGVITASQSKRALECKDCGERFSEVSSLQKHKATVHIIESPGLTYTNGNIFEGVSRLDLYQLPKQNEKVVGVMNSATDWDTEPELGELALEDRERNVSFPSLIPSPSLPVPPSDVDLSAYEDKCGSKSRADDQSHTSQEVHLQSEQIKNSETAQVSASDSPLSNSTQTKSLDAAGPVGSDEDQQEKHTPENPSAESEDQGTTGEDIKEDLLLEVDLVTVGEPAERNDPTPHEDKSHQNESTISCNSEGESTDKPIEKTGNETSDKSLTLQTVSCSTHQEEVKEEEEEMLVQKKKGAKGAFTRNTNRGRRRGTGRLKRDMSSKKGSDGDAVKETESEKEQEECQVVYEKHPVTSDSENNEESETGSKALKKPENSQSPESEANKVTAPSLPSLIEESPEEQVVFELESVTTSVEEVMKERGLQGGQEDDRNQSPGIILEKFLTSRQRATADKESCSQTATHDQRNGLDTVVENEVQVLASQEIKVEENFQDSHVIASTCQSRQSASVQPQHHRDIRTVLVKEEAQAMQAGRHIRWNVEPVSPENTSSPLMEIEEPTRVCTPEFNTNQCIFYPVKEEEREVLLGAAQNNSRTTGSTSDTRQMEHQTLDGNSSNRDQSAAEPGVSDFAGRQAEADHEWQQPAALRDFLLQSSDEEDTGSFELSDPQLDSEAEVMAYFYKNHTNSTQRPAEISQNLPTSSTQLQGPREENRTKEPIDLFSEFFGWDTWVEIANCTNKLANMSSPVTAKEVARFVGIHIAMGTLKFPSPRLYWENLTKVPLIAEAMTLSRFREMSRMLKLASPSKDPVNSNVQKENHGSNIQIAQQANKLSMCGDRQKQGETVNDSSQTPDALWKAQPLLCRFRARCQSLRRDDIYAVDQYPLPLTGKMHNKQMSLTCTTLVGFGGLLLHVDLKLGLSDKESAVEKMVPRGSMVFLCKQELSTPAMLERLLVAGVHGAGRVGGARGQIGDEFVSSDGKLMLRRSHCGFILSTVGTGQRNMASLIDNFEKAQMSAQLSRDLLNLYSIPLTASLAPTCWPQAVLWYLTDLALVNSWLLYRQDHRATSAPLTFMAFRLEVSKALILSSGSDTQDSVPPQPPMEKAHATNETPNPSLVEESPLPDAATRYDGSGHWPEQLGQGEGGRCRYGDCQRTSRVLCLKCCVFLCISRNHNCFLNFHNQGNLVED